MVNDGEARELSGDWNIHRAGRWILAHGPKRVVIKQGEHGALLIEPDAHVLRAGLSAGERLRPHRRGRRVRRRVHGLSRADRLRLARTSSAAPWSYGATMGSYAVEQFGIRGFEHVTLADVEARVRAFRDLTHVELAEPLGMTSAGEYAAAGVDLASADEAKARIGRLVAGTRTAALGRQGRRLRRAWCGSPPACGGRRWC